MKRIINPCTCRAWHNNGSEYEANAFVEIDFNNGNLSIHGVVAPLPSGNCRGCYGQCVDEIRNGKPKDGWTKEMLEKLCDIWGEWHLNDMKPYCEHQKEMGWREQAREEIYLYHYRLKREYNLKKESAEKTALVKLKSGKTFTPTDEQVKFSNLSYFYDTYDELKEGDDLYEYYEPYKSCIGTPEKEIKTRGWVRYNESEKGILCKPCPVCGYKYGTKWLKEEVPQGVIDWLFALPETKIKPAWI